MGLDAYVRCRCWQDGLTTEPPVPHELIVEDEDGDLCLSLPYPGNEDLHHTWDTWLAEGACAHEDMEELSVRIGNWHGYGLFRQALEIAGWEGFPVLSEELPLSNGGRTSPEAASRMLEELRRFAERTDLGARFLLVDEENGATLTFFTAGYGGVFIWAGASRRRLGIDRDGFFVVYVDDRPPQVEFRARHFAQEAVEEGHVRFTDLDDGTSAVVPLLQPVGLEGGRFPRRLRVDTVRTGAADFTGIVASLTAVCEASVRTGNPVRWA